MPDFPRLRKVFESLSDLVIRVSSLVLKEEHMKLVTKKAAIAALMAGLAAVSFAGCNRGTTTSAGGEASGGASGAATGKRACVILPDAESSSRWENGDRPELEQAFKAQGVETDIQNAQNDTGKYATLAAPAAHQGLRGHAARRPERAGVQVAQKAKAQGVPGHRLRPADQGRRLLHLLRQLPRR